VRGFWPGLGAKSWASAGHGRQPVRSLLITGHHPGSSDTVPVNLWHILWMRVLRYGCLLSWLFFVDRYRLLPISFKGCHERLAGVRPRARSNNLCLIEQVLEAYPRNVSLEGSLLRAAQPNSLASSASVGGSISSTGGTFTESKDNSICGLPARAMGLSVSRFSRFSLIKKMIPATALEPGKR